MVLGHQVQFPRHLSATTLQPAGLPLDVQIYHNQDRLSPGRNPRRTKRAGNLIDQGPFGLPFSPRILPQSQAILANHRCCHVEVHFLPPDSFFYDARYLVLSGGVVEKGTTEEIRLGGMT